MGNTSGIRSHMKSIQKTVQISNAQKLISGVRILKAHKELERSRLFHERIRSSAASILGDCETKNQYLDIGQEIKKRGLLVITADRGLAGGYNNNIMKLAAETNDEKPIAKLLTVGLLGYRKFAKMGLPLVGDFMYSVESPSLFDAREIAERMIHMYESGEVDSFDIIYTTFVTPARMYPTLERLIPLSPEMLGKPRVLYAEYAPSADEVLEVLIPKYLKGYIFGCLVQAWICELSSRVNAMDNAIRNGNDMLARLSLQYNRIRQGSITQEISEIVAGANSMADEEEI